VTGERNGDVATLQLSSGQEAPISCTQLFSFFSFVLGWVRNLAVPHLYRNTVT
jgi:hypothetical protein